MNHSEPKSYTDLIDRIDQFIRKYYMNEFIRGTLLFVGLVLFLFILFSTLEYNFYFDSATRKVLFFGFLGIAGLSLFFWIMKPLLSFFKLGKVIDHEMAADIIGTHFINVKDKLLNILQLKDQIKNDSSTSLLLASIDQKTQKIKPIPFQRAIDLTKNKKYLKYALPPVLLLGIILLMAPSLISEGSNRIIQNNKHFEKPAPFRFIVSNLTNLTAVQYSDVEILIDTEGEFVPEKVFIELGDHTFQLEEDDKHDFRFLVKKIKENATFILKSGEVKSQAYEIDVLKKPQFTNMAIRAVYPSYIGRAPETFENNGDLTVPHGTRLQWVIDAQQTSAIHIRFPQSESSDLILFHKNGANEFSYKKGAYANTSYTLYASSSELMMADSMQYVIETIPDQHPSISAQSVEDSLNTDFRFFTGKADDDYGLSALNIVSYVKTEKGIEKDHTKKSLKPVGGLFTSFDYLFSVDSFHLEDGDELFYHFEVWDNDGIQGSKVSKTMVYSYKKASLKELEEKTKENNEDIKDALKKNLEKTQELKKEIKELRDKFLNKKELNWQDKKDAEKLKDKQQEIKEALERAREMMQENKANEEKLSNAPEDLQQKQEKLDELMDKVMDDELKQLMDEINKLLEEMQREKSIDQMQEMEMKSQEMELEMDKMLELFKQLEIEQQLQKEIDKLNELAEKQEELSEETKDGKKSEEELKKEQEKLSEEFDRLKKELEKLREKNKDLENPRNIEDTEKLENEIKKDQKDSEDALDKNSEKQDEEQDKSEEQNEDEKNEEEQENEKQDTQPSGKQKAAKSQKKAGQKMKQMAQDLQAGMMAGQAGQMGEDIEMLRQLLENILTLSFEEEELINELKRTNKNTTKYVELVQGQFKIQDDFSIVRDSLHALSKRNDQIQTFIMDKVADIELNMEKSLNQLEQREKAKGNASQQFVMTFLNDLAVMLSESLANMQQQMASMMPGNQMCNNPKPGQGGASKPMDKITKGQKGIQEGLQKMMEGMEKNGQKPTSEEFGKMAQQQAAMRKMLRDMQKENSEKGQNNRMLQEIIDAMNGIEKDLVNKNLTNEMLKRQQEIQTRLLEAEKAERQRDLDDKRESKTAERVERTIPPAIEQYLKQRNNQLREVNRTSPLLTPYYKRLVDLYYQSLNK